MSDTEFSEPIRCLHCGNLSRMEVLESKSRTRSYEEEVQLGGYTALDEWEVGYRYRLLECCACQGIVLTRSQVHTGIDPEGADSVHEAIYPPQRKVRALFQLRSEQP